MRKISIVCDHCGKELDDMHDYVDMEIDDFMNCVETDLCSECFHELNDMILQYINKKNN